MKEWDEDPDVVTRMKYQGHTVKIIVSEVNEEMIRIMDTSGLTDVSMMILVSRLLWNRIKDSGSVAGFTHALQAIAIQLIDAKLKRDT
ncbi:MAG: hypothetical protein DRR06_09930 [Gammaproteobacteria bacterium]|nr:MAG: hypothetical protein DRR06_09930 [Gammaproteobacteria bacterium]